MSASDYLENKVLDHTIAGTTYTQPTAYVSLHSGDPGETGGSEITGGSYARVDSSGSWAAAASGSKATNADLSWTNMPATTVTHVGIYDASTSGNLLYSGSLSASKAVNSGDTFKFTSGNLTVTLD